MASIPRGPEDTGPQLRSFHGKVCTTPTAQRSTGGETLVTAEGNGSRLEMAKSSCRVQASKEQEVSSVHPSISAVRSKKTESKSPQIQSKPHLLKHKAWSSLPKVNFSESACSSSKPEMAKLSCRKSTPPTVQPSKEQGVSSMHPSIVAERTKKTESKSGQMQSASNLLRYSTCSNLAKVNSLVKSQGHQHLQGQYLLGAATAAIVAVDHTELSTVSLGGSLDKGPLVSVDADMKVSSPVLNLKSSNTLFVVEEGKINSLSDASELLEQAESECRPASHNHEWTIQKQAHILAGDYQQMESSIGLSIGHKAMQLKKELPQTLKQDQPLVSVKKKSLHCSGSNEQFKMQNLVSSPGSKSIPRQQQLIAEMEQSKKVAGTNVEDNILRSVQLLQSSACQAQRLPDLEQSTIGQRDFQSLAETMAIQATQARYRHPNFPQRQLNPINHLALPSTNFQSMIDAGADSSPFGYSNLAELYTRTNLMSGSPRSGYTVTDFNNQCYASPLYGFGNAEHSFASVPNMQLYDRRFSISSESSILNSGTKSSPSPYSSPGSPFDVHTPVHISQYAGAGLVSSSSSNTRFSYTKPARACSPSSCAGTSCPDSVPHFQLEDDVLIMDGVLVEKQSPSPVQNAWSYPTLPNRLHRAGKSILEASILGSPSFFPREDSGSTHFPDAQSHQIRSDSLSRTIEGLRSGAMGEAKSNAVEVHAAECSTTGKLQWAEHLEYSPEVVRALNLPADLDFLYEISQESDSSRAKQYEASPPLKHGPSFLDMSENASVISSKSTPSPCKGKDSTEQSNGTMNMFVNSPKFSARSPAKSSPSFPKHAIDAPPFIPGKGTLRSSKETETAQSSAEYSPPLPKALAEAVLSTPPQKTSRGAMCIPAKSPSFAIKDVQSPAKRSPPIHKNAARASPYTPAKGISPTSSKTSLSPTAVNMAEIASPAKRAPRYPKKSTIPVSSTK